VLPSDSKVPVTILLAVKNEQANMQRCLSALGPAERVVVLDSHSTDATQRIALAHGAEVVQFDYRGGYPKKRQWALETLPISTEWVFLLDADEVITPELWSEIRQAIGRRPEIDAFSITKGFHFLGRPMRRGGFSHSAVLMFRRGKARFERLFDDDLTGMDMEVHERVLVEGKIGRLDTPLIHEDFKGLQAYIDRHNKYSTWEAKLRSNFLSSGKYGQETIRPNLFGNSQERRRALKALVVRIPFEQWIWFFYHYVVKLGLLEGRRGLIACQIRMSYIAQVRAKMYELALRESSHSGATGRHA
jgi:glycosyltransferase involved in cell wall biosynthesis